VFGSRGSVTIEPTERFVATDALPGSCVHDAPPSVDLNTPRPASESLEPLGSPEPAYRVPCAASKYSDPNAVVGRSERGAVHCGCSASASAVRQMPPPAAATQARQLPLSHAGSTAIAVTRPDSWVGGPCWVTGSKNCDASPATFGVIGPRPAQLPGAAARALR
jgi:hypothetical protein